ncbi:MAG: leucine-rich repeat domain-containing protein [Clostridia bacterium]|nr:leucine-rich repeat domain-containing protein [Clostridia bacterium]
MAHDIFISYSIKDRLKADAICHILEEERIRCWVAPRDISPGGSWAAEIADAIPMSKIMLLVFSQNANASKQVLREIELAISGDVIIIPVKIEDVLPTGGMSYYLSTTHWIDAVGGKLDTRIQKLAEKLRSMLQIDAEPPKTSAVEEKTENTIPVASSPPPSEKIDSGIKKKNKRKPIIILATVLAAIAMLVAGYFLYPYVFGEYTSNKQAENPSSSDSMKTMDPSRFPYPGATGESAAVPADYGLNPSTRVIIEDESLKNAILDTLDQVGKPIGDYLTIQDMFNLTCLALGSPGEDIPIDGDLFQPEEIVFSFIDSDISSLSGLQYAYNLKALSISNCSISDLYPLSILGNLKFIYMHNNKISDLQPLSGLSNLRSLHLGGNQITDISPLSGLTELECLHIPENPIIDLSTLSELTGLRSLGLDGLDITDLSFVASLDILNDLNVNDNKISNLEPLSGMANLSSLGISRNNLIDLSSLSGIPWLKSLDISENPIQDFSALSDLEFLRNLTMHGLQLSDLSMLRSMVFLEELRLGNNNISELAPLEGLDRLINLDLNDNDISDISPLVKLDKLQNLNLLRNPLEDMTDCEAMESLTTLYIDIGTYQKNIGTVKYLKSKGCSVLINSDEFSDVIIFEPTDYGYNPESNILVVDENVRAGIFETLSAIGSPIDRKIQISDMFELIYLDFCPEYKEPEYYNQDIYDAIGFSEAEHHVVRVNDITELDGLQYAKNLMFLSLPYYNISNLSPLYGLNNLLFLWIDSTTGLSNINALENLVNLRRLKINNLNSSDITPLSNLYRLYDLSISSYGNVDLDLTPLTGLGLGSLSLNGFNITDLEPIGTLRNLSSLTIRSSNASGLIPLSYLSNLEYLYISDNSVSDISPLAELQNLRHLTLENCSIDSIEGLQNLVNLQELWLDAHTYDSNPLIVKAIKNNGCAVYRINP